MTMYMYMCVYLHEMYLQWQRLFLWYSSVLELVSLVESGTSLLAAYLVRAVEPGRRHYEVT